MTIDACQRGHDWAAAGVFIDGVGWGPCHRPGCTWGARVMDDGALLEREGVFPSEIGGVTLDIQDDPRGGVAKVVMYELAHSYLVEGIPFREGDVVLDIGAHVGVVSCYLGKRWPGLRVYAFEPMMENYVRLRRNLQANNVANVVAWQLAVSGNGRAMRLASAIDSNSGGSTAYSASEGERRVVRSVTLARLFEQLKLDRVRLLKMDVEGAEYETIMAEPSLLDRVDYLVGEFHENPTLTKAGYSIAALQSMVEEHIDPAHVRITACRMGA